MRPIGRSAVRRAALTMWVIFGLVPGADSAAAEPTPVPCSAIGGGKYECSWWRPGDGRTGGAIVVRDGKVVGYLHHGRNWITCQQEGGKVYNEDGNKNKWYGWTVSDYGGTGWASALDAKGGDDYGGFEGVPKCHNKHGPAPGVEGLWSTTPPGGSEPPDGGDGGGGKKPSPKRKNQVKAPVLLGRDETCVHKGKHEDQRRVARFNGTHLAREDGVPPPTGVPWKWDYAKDFRIGTVTISATTCWTRRGWAITRTVNVVVDSSDKPFDSLGNEHTWGLGIWHRRKKSPRHFLNVMFTQCWENHSLEHLGEFLDLIPLMETGKKGLDLALEGAKVVGLKLLSAKSEYKHCVGRGTYELKLLVDSRGRFVVKPGPDHSRAYNEPAAAGFHHRWEIKRFPSIRGNP